MDTANECFDVRINGRKAVDRLDVAAKAGGRNRALDLVFNGIEPRNGIIEIRFIGKMTAARHGPLGGQAFVQALEVGLGDGGPGAVPLPATPPSTNLLENPQFDDTDRGVVLNSGGRATVAGWTYQMLADGGKDAGFFFPEWQYIEHPPWGLPEFHGDGEALRTHTSGKGHLRIYQDVKVEPGASYTASAWVRAADIQGQRLRQGPEGFGRPGHRGTGRAWEGRPRASPGGSEDGRTLHPAVEKPDHRQDNGGHAVRPGDDHFLPLRWRAT